MKGVIGITRIAVAQGALVEVEPTYLGIQAEVKKVDPAIQTSLWRHEEDDHRFLQLVTIPSVEVYERLGEHMMRSRVVEEASIKLVTTPDVQHFIPEWSGKTNEDSAHQQALLSISLRAMDPGYGPEWISKLTDNFREVSVIPGFAGAVVARSTIVDDQILGLAFWDVSTAFRQSVPPHPHYLIELYRRFR